LLIFTEHRDTLEFLIQRLEGIGYGGQVAQVHGGMDYRQRTEQIAFFQKPVAEGGARYMVATDAAGEGLNMQFCWLMVNYDIPWNPARLEQRLGRIHRYGQKHDPVIILNLVAGKTREGRVLQILLDKLERIRRELNSDKVFDVIGRLFEGVSLREYLEQAVSEEGVEAASRRIEGTLTTGQVAALAEREKRLYGDGGDVKAQLPDQEAIMERERWRRLLPGYVRRFLVQGREEATGQPHRRGHQGGNRGRHPALGPRGRTRPGLVPRRDPQGLRRPGPPGA
jgi:superfamily II DNA/RNA helicase